MLLETMGSPVRIRTAKQLRQVEGRVEEIQGQRCSRRVMHRCNIGPAMRLRGVCCQHHPSRCRKSRWRWRWGRDSILVMGVDPDADVLEQVVEIASLCLWEDTEISTPFIRIQRYMSSSKREYLTPGHKIAGHVKARPAIMPRLSAYHSSAHSLIM
jgi:hypothetical protein